MMKKILPVLLAFALIALNIGSCSQEETQSYSGKGFSFDYPSEFDILSRTENGITIASPLHQNDLALIVVSKNARFDGEDFESATKLLDEMLTGLEATRTETTVAGISAIDVRTSLEGNPIRFILTEKQDGYFYCLSFISPSGLYNQYEQAFEKVRDSFRIQPALVEEAAENARRWPVGGEKPTGFELPHAKVVCDGVDYYGRSRAYTGTDGRFRIPVRPNSVVRIWATKGELSSSVLIEATLPADQENNVGDLILCAPGEGIPATTLVVSPASFTLQFGQTQTLTATLTSGGSPLASKTITWYATDGSVSPSSDTTDNQGQVSVTYTAPWSTQTVAVTAYFAGDVQYQSSVGESSGTITVVPSFDAPANDPGGLAWDGTYLWCADVGTDKIYKLDSTTGSVVSSFDSPGTYPTGLAWDGTYLWCTDSDTDKIYKLDSTTGSVVSSFDSPGTYPTDLAWDGTYLWCTDMDTDKIYKLDSTTGSVVSSFDSPETVSRGLAWDGTCLWNADGYYDKIYKLNPTTGAVISSFDSPGTWPRGLAWDGTYLWNTDKNSRKIYKIDVSALS